MRRWNLPKYGLQARLLRIALVSLLLILALSLLATVTQAAGQDSIPVTIIYHGQTTRTSTAPGTVGEMLTRLGVELSGEDVVSHEMEQLVTADMEVVIDRVVCRRETYTTAMEHAVTECWDPSTREGVEEVLVPGVDGELCCTADVTYINGREVSREILHQAVVSPTVTAVIAKGCGLEAEDPKEGQILIADGYITLPTGEMLTYTEVRSFNASAYSHMDRGCDSVTATGTTVHWGTVAVNPSIIPYGTRMFITSSDGSYVYGIATAEDFGGAADRIDLYMSTYHECIQFGRRECKVYFLG